MTEAATIEVFESTLATVASTYGEFVAFGTPTCKVVGDYTVVDVPLALEKGDGVGKVSFNADEQVAGIYLLPSDTP